MADIRVDSILLTNYTILWTRGLEIINNNRWLYRPILQQWPSYSRVYMGIISNRPGEPNVYVISESTTGYKINMISIAHFPELDTEVYCISVRSYKWQCNHNITLRYWQNDVSNHTLDCILSGSNDDQFRPNPRPSSGLLARTAFTPRGLSHSGDKGH